MRIKINMFYHIYGKRLFKDKITINDKIRDFLYQISLHFPTVLEIQPFFHQLPLNKAWLWLPAPRSRFYKIILPDLAPAHSKKAWLCIPIFFCWLRLPLKSSGSSSPTLVSQKKVFPLFHKYFIEIYFVIKA